MGKIRKLIRFSRKLFDLFLIERKKRLTRDHVVTKLDTDEIQGTVEFIEGSGSQSIVLITMRIDKELLK
jgi:hypothetical protein